ncbi:MAG: DoxX family protein [Deltaproteobacteria bacterium]|nr:DoxX family protein [Deltaproteobacteria bacterium]
MANLILKTDNSPVQMFIRVVLGAVIFPHGAQKLLGWFGGAGLEKTLHSFSQMGFPVWATVLLMLIESMGALLLIAGFLTRFWALAIGTAMAVCMLKFHVQYGFFMNWFNQQGGEGYEYHILVLGIAVALLIKGGGMLSVDRALATRVSRRRLIR